MLPYPTDHRHLLLMVRMFVYQLTEHVRSDIPSEPYRPPDYDDPLGDAELEEFLERLAMEVDEEERDIAEMGYGEETEAEVVESLRTHLEDLKTAASWNKDRPSPN